MLVAVGLDEHNLDRKVGLYLDRGRVVLALNVYGVGADFVTAAHNVEHVVNLSCCSRIVGLRRRTCQSEKGE